MTVHNVLFQVRCSADDPHAPARVMGVFASRSLLPQRFASTVTEFGIVEIEVQIVITEGETTTDLEHLARLIDRFPVVETVRLLVDGKTTTFEVAGTPSERKNP